MTPKEVVQKGYDCFTSGDMETFVGLFHDECVVTMNGMHKFSGTYNGINEFMGVLAQIPSHFGNFSVKVTNMISEGDQVSTQLDATADGLEAKFGHFHKMNPSFTEKCCAWYQKLTYLVSECRRCIRFFYNL